MSCLQIYQGGLRGEPCVVLVLHYVKNQSGIPTLNQHPDQGKALKDKLLN